MRDLHAEALEQGAPVCAFCRRRPIETAWRPFCSERCKIQDLARWAAGTYRIPGDPLPGPDDTDWSEP